MASSTTQTPQSSTLPLHQTNPATTKNPQTGSSTQSSVTSSVKIPDGRKNSVGETVSSPTETWRPNLGRTQSWNQEDLRRQHTMTEIQKDRDTLGGGFTEVVAGKSNQKV